jgi:heme oxygenase (biliverdin-IX-beta and delta-forming)
VRLRLQGDFLLTETAEPRCGRRGPSKDEAPPLFVRLRRETSALHAEVETLVPILKPSVGVHDYREFLIRLWRFHRPIELRLRGVAELGLALPDLDRRYKVHLLEADLAALGQRAAIIDDPIDEGPVLSGLAGALGCLYVVEGSTLGGRLIHRHLAHHLPGSIENASRFLTCYGEDCGRSWVAFRFHAERAARTLDHDEIVTAARETFSAAKRCFMRSNATHANGRSS